MTRPRSLALAAVAAVLAAPALVGVGGCGPRTVGPGEPKELLFWAMGREGEVVRELMPDFERAHPGVRVRVQQIPWTAAHEKMITAFVGERTPDLSQMGNTWIPEFVALGALDPLTPRLGPAVPEDGFFPGIWATNEVDAVVYGVPWYVDTRVVFYRPDLYAQAGYPTFPTTWADWRTAMERVQARRGPGQYAALFLFNEWVMPAVLGLQKGSPLLRDGGRYGDFRSPRYREAFAFYKGLIDAGLAPTNPGTLVPNVYDGFANGTFATYVTGPWNLGEFRSRLPDSMQTKWATAPLPGPNGPGESLAGGASLVLFKGARHKAEAWQLLEYLARPDVQLRFYRLTGSLPARREAWADTALQNDPRTRAFGVQLERAVPMPRVPEWERIATRLNEATEAIVRGGVSLDEGLRRLDADVDRMLDKRRYVLRRDAEGAARAAD